MPIDTILRSITSFAARQIHLYASVLSRLRQIDMSRLQTFFLILIHFYRNIPHFYCRYRSPQRIFEGPAQIISINLQIKCPEGGLCCYLSGGVVALSSPWWDKCSPPPFKFYIVTHFSWATVLTSHFILAYSVPNFWYRPVLDINLVPLFIANHM